MQNMRNMRNIGAILAMAGLFSFPLPAQAQGITEGAARGAQQGGAAAGLLGSDQRPRFRDYVIRERKYSHRLDDPVTVGMVLPPTSIASTSIPLYPIPPKFGVPTEYRYAMVNDQAVLVEPRSRRIVEVID